MIILAWIIAVLSVITIIIGFAGKLLSFEMSEANKVIGEVKGMTKEGSIIEFDINGEKKIEKHPNHIPIGNKISGVYESNNDTVIIDGSNSFMEAATRFLIFDGLFGLAYAILVIVKVFTTWTSLVLWGLGIFLFVLGMFYSYLVSSVLNDKNIVAETTCIEHKEHIVEDKKFYSGIYTYSKDNKEYKIHNFAYVDDESKLIPVNSSEKAIFLNNEFKLVRYKTIEKYLYLRYIMLGISAVLFILAFVL